MTPVRGKPAFVFPDVVLWLERPDVLIQVIAGNDSVSSSELVATARGLEIRDVTSPDPSETASASEEPQASGPPMVSGPATTGPTVNDHYASPPVVVTDVRVSGYETFERIVFEIGGDGDVGWRIRYEDDPRTPGAGDPVTLRGDAVLQIDLLGIAYPDEAPAPPYDGPDRFQPTGTDVILEVFGIRGAYEGQAWAFVGLSDKRPYRVARLNNPQRLVIDIEK